METVENRSEAPAIRALGSLFKLTKVYLWGDGAKETRLSSLVIRDDGDKDTSSDFSALPEDIELAEEMNALGLPLSFHTNKEMRSKTTSSKKKGVCPKNTHVHKGTDETLEFSRVSEMDIVSPPIFNDNSSSSFSCMSMLGPSESSYHDVAVAVNESKDRDHKQEDSASLARTICGFAMDQKCEGVSDLVTNDGRNHDFAQQSGIMCEDDENIAMDSNSLSAEISPECCLMERCLDHGKNEGDRSLMDHEHFECSSGAYCNENGEKLCNYNGDDFGDWRVYWDSFYMRNYFYNVKTQASKWNPPPGMENLVFDNLNDRSTEMTTESLQKSVHDGGLEELLYDELSNGTGPAAASSLTIPSATNSFEHAGENCEINGSCHVELTSGLISDAQENVDSMIEIPTGTMSNDYDILLETVTLAKDQADNLLVAAIKKGKKKTRRRAQRKLSRDDKEIQFQGMFEENSAIIGKYWCQRYLLFSRFDDGIKMDEEGWFSVTPEPIARHHASRCGSGIIIDSFTGVGGNAIQFAQRSAHVIAIDIDPKKIDYAYHNAALYGVNDRIDFVIGDFFVLARELKADTVFLSPPWGGPDYTRVEIYDLKTMLRPRDGYFLFNAARKIAGRIVMFLPRNVDLNQLAELSLSMEPPWLLEVEKNFLNGKLKAITAYFTETAGR